MMVWCLLFRATLSQLWDGDTTSRSRLTTPGLLSKLLTVSNVRLCQARSLTMGFLQWIFMPRLAIPCSI